MIYGERIRFRAVERDDVPRYVEWFNDREVTAGLARHLPMASWDEMRWFERLVERPEVERPFAVDAKSADGWKHIGSVGLMEFKQIERSAEFGIVIGDKNYWNNGYGTEMTRLMLKHGFENLNLNRIMLQVHATNPRAIRTYEKAGFVHEGVLREALYRNGVYLNMLVMSVLRSEWDLFKEK